MFYCGLDISLRKTSICIVDRDGVIAKETTVASDPEAIDRALRDSGFCLERIGIEAGSTSSWLLAGLRAGLAGGLHRRATPPRRCRPASGTRLTGTTPAASPTSCS